MSTLLDRLEWPFREHRLDVAWGLFALVNLLGMVVFAEWETVPFHFIWVSLTLVYGFRVWALKPTALALLGVIVGTAALIAVDVHAGSQPLDELTEVPLMSAMFLAMVWHARRRLASMQEVERMSEANLRLLERERRFVQDASHELRTPITVALGHAELIKRTAIDAQLQEDAAVVAEELLRLRTLADRLLALASLEEPGTLRPGPCDVDALVQDAVRRWSATPRRWSTGTLSAGRTVLDRDRIGLALDSLIENALKNSREGEAIRLSARRDGPEVVIEVDDDGFGIAPEHHEVIFDRFARVDSGRTRGAGGIGLGLSMVKAIVEAHGGTVSVRSSPGAGSVFEMRLPAVDRPPGRAASANLDEDPAGWPRDDVPAAMESA